MNTFKSLLWILAFLAAAGFSYFIPPMQSPDEMSHIERAYLISKGRFFLEKLPTVLVNGPRKYAEDAAFMERARQHGGPIGGMVDQGLLQYIAFNFELVLDYNRKFSDSENNQISKIKWASNEEYHVLPGAGYYFPAIYTPQALGFSIGRLFDLNVGNSYYLARGLVLAACFALFWLASRLLTPNPLAVAILFLPMSMFQMLSPTIDGLTTALAVLACSLFMAAADLSRGHPRFSSWGLALCVFILATARTHTLPLLVLPFYIAWVRRSPRDLYLGCTATAATLGWVLYAMNSTNDPRVAQESFIGILGWLDTKLPHFFYPTLWLGLAICALVGISWHTLQRDWFPRLLLIGVALTSVCLIFLALLLTWTPHPTSLVQGVQGRYFVVPMILLAYSVSGFAVFRGPTHRVLTWVVLAGFALTALTALMMALFSRYGSAAVS
ncbi:MAG: DUF2142 domain-containing protein [Comamonadaceae bacterium]|uniref:DUF2142 domain-containing protein n=1 Tax=Candidatus Skiveiella danica TaxID=3386177 RepID=UPI00390935AF|nr:DUF2142 domain-containing protein [Comamonadaceae bacterium]